MVVTNDTVAPLYLQKVLDALGNTPKESVVLPDGEAFKNMDTLDQIFDGLLSNDFDRGCTVIALGGGVIGDMAGFAAASYQRGVNLIQIPTTLLAQVDSSVGGKTAVNHSAGQKYDRRISSTGCGTGRHDLCSTLPDREFKGGSGRRSSNTASSSMPNFSIGWSNNMPAFCSVTRRHCLCGKALVRNQSRRCRGR